MICGSQIQSDYWMLSSGSLMGRDWSVQKGELFEDVMPIIDGSDVIETTAIPSLHLKTEY